MRTRRWVEVGWLIALLLPSAIAAGDAVRAATGVATMAENDTGDDREQGRDVLVVGKGTAIKANSPVNITIDVGARPPPRAKLELSLAPSDAADERYLIVVDLGKNAGAKRLGAVSFYPPRQGVAQAFYFDLAPAIAEANARRATQIDLQLTLTPAERGQTLTAAEVRVVGARLIAD